MALHGSAPSFHGCVKLNPLQSSCISSLFKVHCLPSPSLRQYKFVLPPRFGRGDKNWFSPGYYCLNSQAGRHTLPYHDTRFLPGRCQRVKSEDSESILSGESIALNEQILEEELQTAIAEENYAKAAKIRDTLKNLHRDSKTLVLAANNQFYDSFRIGDLAAMQALWAKRDEVCCVHPGVKGISGYDDVIESWEFVWANYEFPLGIQLKDIQVFVRGDVGYVTCMEFVKTKGGRWGGQFVTNVFERIDGKWFICIHHASPVDL